MLLFTTLAWMQLLEGEWTSPSILLLLPHLPFILLLPFSSNGVSSSPSPSDRVAQVYIVLSPEITVGVGSERGRRGERHREAFLTKVS